MTKANILTLIAVSALSVQLCAKGNSVSYGGFLSAGYLESSANNYLADTEDGDFEFAEIGLNATWSPIERTTVSGQLFAFDVGPYGNLDPIVDYLFLDYNVSPAFGVRLGRVKRAEGIYTDIQDIDAARTSILLPIGMYDQRYRDFSASVDGASFYGNLQAGSNNSFDYTLYYGKVDFGIDGGVAGYAHTLVSRGLLNAEIDSIGSDTNTGLQVWWNTPVLGLRIGSSYSYYDNIELQTSGIVPVANLPVVNRNTAEVDMIRLSAEYFLGDWTFISEYNQMKTNSVQSMEIAGMPTPAEASEATGYSWYVSAARRFLDRFEGAVTYAEYYDDDRRTSDPQDYQKDWQFSFRYNATDFWILKAEVHFLEGTNRLFNQYGQNPGPVDSSWNLFAAKSTFTF